MTRRAYLLSLLLLAQALARAPALAEEPELRRVDIAILLAAAHEDLSQGRFREVRDAVRPLLTRDATYHARYYLGVACSRLNDWECADENLTAVASSPQAASFPQLMLELGIVKLGRGELGAARALLEQARARPDTHGPAERYLATVPVRPLRVTVGLQSGFDSNVVGAGSAVSLCAPYRLGDRDFSASCGGSLAERLLLELSTRLAGQGQQVSYQVQHVWFPGQDLEEFTLFSHRLVASSSLPLELGILLRTDALWLKSQLTHPYALQSELELTWHRALSPRLSTWIGYRIAPGVYGDLSEIWQIDDLVTGYPDVCNPGDDAASGTSSASLAGSAAAGDRPTPCKRLGHGPVLGARLRQSDRATFGATGGLQVVRGWLPNFGGIQGDLNLWAELEVLPRLMFAGALGVGGRQLEAEGEPWRSIRTQALLSARAELSPRFYLWLRHAERWSRIKSPGAETASGETADEESALLTEIDRRQTTLEVLYVY